MRVTHRRPEFNPLLCGAVVLVLLCLLAAICRAQEPESDTLLPPPAGSSAWAYVAYVVGTAVLTLGTAYLMTRPGRRPPAPPSTGGAT